MAFWVHTTAHFDRAFRKLARQHPDLADRYGSAISALKVDPYNTSRTHPIKKLEGISSGQGQYRFRSGRFRFVYDIEGRVVYLKACFMRREDSYR